MVRHEVQHQLHPALMKRGAELIHVLDSSVGRMDVVIVRYVVAHVDLGGFENGIEPDDIHSQALDIVQFGNHSLEIAYSVPIGVLEGRRVDLVYRVLFPPRLRNSIGG